jgi:hypothetical protein
MTSIQESTKLDISRNGILIGSFELDMIQDLINTGQLELTDEYTQLDGRIVKLSELIATQPLIGSPNNAIASIPNKRILSNFQLALFFLSIVALAGFLLMVFISRESESLFKTEVSNAMTSNRDQNSVLRSLSELEIRIHELVASNFVEKKSETDGKIFYTHKFYHNIGNRIILRARVENSGECFLYTYYMAQEWLFLKQISFQIGKDTFTTSRLNPYETQREVIKAKGVYESCLFKSESDLEIMKKISLNVDQTVNMKLIGRTTLDKNLSYESKVAIKDSLALADLLTERNKMLQALSLSL